ncbi:DUF397 domain-containing protein [Nocardiopsis sediminis]|uniref:DUF397 domain-containing protein n=1 Tax=Nocardiopsis sediminis TaxID=1778267 RepID=A0ABV8FFB5_9ACTN
MPDSPLTFRKSSYSSAWGQDCVEVAGGPDFSAVRDSQRPEAGHLLFSRSEFSAFLEVAKAGEL